MSVCTLFDLHNFWRVGGSRASLGLRTTHKAVHDKQARPAGKGAPVREQNVHPMLISVNIASPWGHLQCRTGLSCKVYAAFDLAVCKQAAQRLLALHEMN